MSDLVSDLTERLTGTALLSPAMLLLALLVPVALLLAHRRRAAPVPFAPARFLSDGLGATWRVRALPLPRVLQAAGLLLLVIALARPVQRDRLPLATEGIDVVLCLDISSSMNANDMDGSRTRLAVAQRAAEGFIAGRAHDRIGLVTFARYPEVRCPPTLDHAALTTVLTQVRTVRSDGPEDATGIGGAVARAAQILRASEAKSKVAILLTDGEENIATAQSPAEIAPLHAAQLCRELGVRVYTIAAGVGRREPDGSWTAIDTREVQEVSQRTGGRFFEARDAGAAAEVYAAIDTLEKSALAEPRYRIRERFLPVLAGAVLLLVGARMLSRTLFEVVP